MSTRSAQDRFLMMGDNSPRSKDSRGWDSSDPAWDTAEPQVLGSPPQPADRQGVLRLLAARRAVRARHPAQPRYRDSVPALCRTDEVDPLRPSA